MVAARCNVWNFGTSRWPLGDEGYTNSRWPKKGATRSESPNLFLRWEILHVIGQRFGVDWPVVHAHAGGGVKCPYQCVLHPGLVEPFRKVLTEVSAAALLPVERSGDRHGCLRQQIAELQCLD